MKHILLIILSVFLSLTTLTAQDFWEQLPVPDSIRISKIAVNNNRDIFIGAWEGTTAGGVYRSTDSGQTWIRVLTLEVGSVLSLAITDDNVIFAGTNSFESLYKSIDNGDSWNPVTIPLSGYLLPEIAVYGVDTIFLSEVITGGGALTMSVDGGDSWNIVYEGVNHSSEAINDIVKMPNGNIYIGLEGYLQNQGGVYRTVNNGQSWEYVGLLNHMIMALTLNSKGDLFAGSWGGGNGSNAGVFVLRAGQQNWDTLSAFGQISDIVINTEDHIYCSSSWPDGIIRSYDDGVSFNIINSGIPNSPMGAMEIDNNDYIYFTSSFITNFLAKSVNTTVSNKTLKFIPIFMTKIFPNPIANDEINIELASPTYGTTEVLIYSQTGQLIFCRQIFLTGINFSIDSIKLKSGIYNLVLINNEQRFTVQFIKP
jgi:hypothetical protein